MKIKIIIGHLELIIGPSGSGKTNTLLHLRHTNLNTNI